MSAFVRACSIALKAEPAVNSMIDGTDQVDCAPMESPHLPTTLCLHCFVDELALSCLLPNMSMSQVFFDYADIGFAAATPKGLVVPILRNAESMSFKGESQGQCELLFLTV